jgi:hypothetical protein
MSRVAITRATTSWLHKSEVKRIELQRVRPGMRMRWGANCGRGC